MTYNVFGGMLKNLIQPKACSAIVWSFLINVCSSQLCFFSSYLLWHWQSV